LGVLLCTVSVTFRCVNCQLGENLEPQQPVEFAAATRVPETPTHAKYSLQH
jgi:hypothetical protein